MQPDWIPYFLGGVVLVEAWLLMIRNTEFARVQGELYGLKRQVADLKEETREYAEWPALRKELIDRQWADDAKLSALRARACAAEAQRDAALIALGQRVIGGDANSLVQHPESQRNAGNEGVADA